MSAYNILNSQITCSNCRSQYIANIQFKFGDTWQIHYKLGDKIRWGGNDIGYAGLTKVKVYGVLETDNCPICGNENSLNEFDINIENDIITSLNPINDLKEYLKDDGNYKVCIK